MTFEVIAWEPPKERVVQANVAKLEDVQVSFGVAAKRTFAAANPKGCDISGLSVHLDAAGLKFAAAAEQPAERLAEIPVGRLLRLRRGTPRRSPTGTHRGGSYRRQVCRSPRFGGI